MFFFKKKKKRLNTRVAPEWNLLACVVIIDLVIMLVHLVVNLRNVGCDGKVHTT